MFYSKYRPQKFSDLVGLETLSRTILTALSTNNLAHAYFFYGPRGTGKTSAARLLAKAVNCEELSKSDVCGKCSNCKSIEKGKFLDLIEIDAASNRGIDDIRAIKDKVSLAPTHKKAKVYIIDEVHMLTTDAFNALLKTLEEPPKRVYFVLCTTDPQKVPDTIKSRCIKVEFKRVSEPDIVKKLESILKEEKALMPDDSKYKVTEADLKKIAKAAVGGFRDAETLLEQVLIGGATIDEVIASGGELFIDDFIDSLKNDISLSLGIIQKANGSGVDLVSWSMEFLGYVRKLLLMKAGISRSDLDVSEDKFVVMEKQAALFSLSELADLIDIFSEALRKTKESSLPSLPLEVAIVKWFENFKPDYNNKKDVPKNPNESPRKDFKVNIKGNPKENIDGNLDECFKESLEKEPEEIESPKQEDSTVPPDFCWENLLKAVKPYNHSVEALLKSCRLISFSKGVLHIETFYSFHKERLETPKNRQIVEDTLKELLGISVKLKCGLGKKVSVNEDLTDKNILEPNKEEVEEVAKSVLEVFDGGVEI